MTEEQAKRLMFLTKEIICDYRNDYKYLLDDVIKKAELLIVEIERSCE